MSRSRAPKKPMVSSTLRRIGVSSIETFQFELDKGNEGAEECHTRPEGFMYMPYAKRMSIIKQQTRTATMVLWMISGK
jgi:hypothetical protein